MKKILILLTVVGAVLAAVLRCRQIQEQREVEAEIWAEATDPL
ncbi:DLW-39 family protein [Naumannella cuiyingiana]|uniref:Uncharacterized protein n=1 Tax=Naumannella cuiyingiana TaxID=1347891 RepID=A0A7Z0IKY9_9ACTN|nr:DLW-39 family protein [Naumannella cuiyingiana]NYI71031.1 hypothetical protein [Naumannella cuiyingiana]